MAASNSRNEAPFLGHLTVFKSRLGAMNIVLPLSGFAYIPTATLTKKLREKITASIELPTSESEGVLRYLVEKKLIGGATSRYKDLRVSPEEGWKVRDKDGNVVSSISTYQIDLWMADPALPSTIGAPTPDNSDEMIELCTQLGVLSKAKNTWSSAGQLIVALRTIAATPDQSPMALGVEVTAMLRQVLEKDGLLLREVLREVGEVGTTFSRDSFALRFADIAGRALTVAQALHLPPPVLAEGKKVVRLLEATAAKRGSASRAPGVLEHRTSPRLEWLTDVGALSKAGRQRNSFEYTTTGDAETLRSHLDRPGVPSAWADDAAIAFWRSASCWQALRERIVNRDRRSALGEGYRLLRRSVGPTSMRDVCFAAAVLLPTEPLMMADLTAELLRWASEDKRITVSGGRYSRTPELVHIADEPFA